MIAEPESQNFCEQSSLSSAIPPLCLTPIGGSAKIYRVTCFVNPSFSNAISKASRERTPTPKT